MSESVVIFNLGSPKSPKPFHVWNYLREFLMDPLVIDLPWPARAGLFYGLISWGRPRSSGHAYANIWDAERGSPLIYHTEDFVRKLQARLGGDVRVRMGMRYARPSVKAVLAETVQDNPERITLAAMYPQYALSSNETLYRECVRVLKKLDYKGEVRWVRPFHSEPEFIESFARRGRETLPEKLGETDYVVMSFHGIPERHIEKLPGYEKGHCLTRRGNCCEELGAHNKDCYRAQSYSTARLLAKSLGLRQAQYSVSFQSRLGRTPWIRPYTDFVLKDLASRGHKRVWVFCPSFTTDCLETLEEIQIREAESFRAAGGESLTLVPCLNAEDHWVDGFARMYERLSESVDLSAT